MKRNSMIQRAIIMLAFVFGEPSHGEGSSHSPSAWGFQGSRSYIEAGINVPSPVDGTFLGIRARAMSSITWVTFIHEDGRSVSVHPVVVAGALSFGGRSPLLEEKYRMYGGMEVLLGYSLTPYESAIYGTANLIGDTLTFLLSGFFGAEVFTAPNVSWYLVLMCK
jgi:hypothetical protein